MNVNLELALFDRGEFFVFCIISDMYELSEYFWLSWTLLLLLVCLFFFSLCGGYIIIIIIITVLMFLL